MEDSDWRAIKLFVAALTIFGVLVAGFLGVLGYFGYANTFEESVFGTGTIDDRHDTEHASDHASIVNASVAYEVKRTWDSDNYGSSDVFSSSFIVTGADKSGGYRNKYVVKSSGSGYKHTYEATQISGDFSGSGEVSVTTDSTTDGTSYDSLILMDSRNGNATFQGGIINGQSGKPVNEAEMDAIGKFVIRSYLNITEKPDTIEGWLDFCSGLDQDMILDKSVPDGVYVAPAGYVLQNGKLVKGNSTE